MDESTYWQRVNRIFDMMDVRTAFSSDDDLQEALEACGFPSLAQGHPQRSFRVTLMFIADAVLPSDRPSRHTKQALVTSPVRPPASEPTQQTLSII